MQLFFIRTRNEDSGQIAQISMLILVLVGCTCQKIRFLTLRIIIFTRCQYAHTFILFYIFLSIYLLGSQSDYTIFRDRLGVPIADLAYTFDRVRKHECSSMMAVLSYFLKRQTYTSHFLNKLLKMYVIMLSLVYK